ncbi:MAG TPA: cytidine deaminase [Candidatus Limnocylindria bacterium]|nr:cytidine deaminase [Candidatus Limnocylindria bacterium]
MPVNIELKARDVDPEATLGRCQALGAEDRGSFKQRDTYFTARRGRLKLREQGEGEASELIAYRRPDDAAATESAYVRAPVSAAGELAQALDAALGAVDVVLKRRRLLIWEGVRIHLDEVVGLGSFIEFEAVLPDAGSPDQAQAKVERLRSELSITDEMLVPVGYVDLQLDGPVVLLRAAEAAMRNAYVPYSNFPVGAAVRGRTGAIYAAANVENAAYPQGQCAEASAIGAMVAAGETAITAVAVVAERVDRCPPCGGCRQRLAEFGAADTLVYLGRPDTAFETTSLGELLPLSFGREELGK